MTVNGIDFKINEPFPFHPMWFSLKFKSAGVRYEVAISINDGDIVHIYTPVPCSSCPNITNFLTCLMQKLLPDEMVEAENRYQGVSANIRILVDYATMREKKHK
jgi:hypothetical protein